MIRVFVGLSRILLLEILIFKGLTARRLYKSFDVKRLIDQAPDDLCKIVTHSRCAAKYSRRKKLADDYFKSLKLCFPYSE
jgi:hypothetical protein